MGAGTNLFPNVQTPVIPILTDPNGFIILGSSPTVPIDTTPGLYQHGCIVYNPNEALLPPYVNLGTTGGPFWSHILPATIPFATTDNTNGTTPVAPLFGGPAVITFGIQAVFISSLDVTAGDILVKNNGALVTTITKSTTPGVMTGAVSIANAHVPVGNTMTIESTTTGNATVYIVINPLA